MDAAQIEKLKALALAATKGPWMRLFGERTVYDRMEDGCRGNAIVRADLAFSMQDTNNLDFIAEANPATVLELIAENERRNDELSRLRDWFESQRKAISKGAGSTWDMCQCLDQIARIDAAIGAHQSRNRKGTQ